MSVWHLLSGIRHQSDQHLDEVVDVIVLVITVRLEGVVEENVSCRGDVLGVFNSGSKGNTLQACNSTHIIFLRTQNWNLSLSTPMTIYDRPK